ncbi:MAG: hypothetical protein NVS9B4_24080 [Candidatus Acidiferrum sp.]
MAKWTIFFLLSACALVSAQTPNSPTPGTTTAVEKQLMDLEQKWGEALEKGDAAALGSILDQSYVDTDETGHRSNKQELLEVFKSGDLKISSIKLSAMKVHQYGSAAVVTGRAAQEGAYKGQPLTKAVVFTDTLVRFGGKWRAVSSHRSATNDAS